MKTLLLITDAWRPQTNGVVTTLEALLDELPAMGWRAEVIHPGRFRTLPMPGYAEIRLALNPWRLRAMYREAKPDAVHIATEGPLGIAARLMLAASGIPFTSAVHTRFPEYVSERLGIPLALGYAFMRWMHAPATTTLCTSVSSRNDLSAWGMTHLQVWGGGVDTRRFQPDPLRQPSARPVLLYVGRVAKEKNLEAFLAMNIDAEKRIVGDGPARAALERRFPEAAWLGYRFGDDLVREYATADVFVFPSRTDTLGLVMLEAMACGTPVAAYPVIGPLDVVLPDINGWLDEDLAVAVQRAVKISRETCAASMRCWSWRSLARQFLHALTPVSATPVTGGSASLVTGISRG
ncbi:MAG: glycosyltransferase family 1 protein [Pseudomonadales bacterium]|nr:glycosyltransferase family 1 protein [Pseudomonadales bacterium]